MKRRGTGLRWSGLGRLSLGAGTGLALAYFGLPYAFIQVVNWGLIREGKRTRREVALTFDDGPDPLTTPAVLGSLQAAGAQATFFVSPEKAEAHPELIRQMLDAGHQLGAHGNRHLHAWLRFPGAALLDPGLAARRISAVSGQQITLQRPPHGAYTLATFLGQKRAGLTGAHWSIESRDWDLRLNAAQIRQRLNRLLVPGAVIVLHDAGPGAKNTVPLLPDLLADFAARDYRFKTLARLEGAQPQDWAFIKRRLFSWLDTVYDLIGGVRYSGEQADNLWRVGRVRFPLVGVQLQDGTPVPSSTPAAEFHVNNALFVDLGLRRFLRQAPTDFAFTARDWQESALQDAEVIFCLSSHSQLLELLGFEAHSLSKADTQRLRGWANVLRRAYGNAPKAREPRLSIMTKAKFMELYGPKK